MLVEHLAQGCIVFDHAKNMAWLAVSGRSSPGAGLISGCSVLPKCIPQDGLAFSFVYQFNRAITDLRLDSSYHRGRGRVMFHRADRAIFGSILCFHAGAKDVVCTWAFQVKNSLRHGLDSRPRTYEVSWLSLLESPCTGGPGDTWALGLIGAINISIDMVEPWRLLHGYQLGTHMHSRALHHIDPPTARRPQGSTRLIPPGHGIDIEAPEPPADSTVQNIREDGGDISNFFWYLWNWLIEKQTQTQTLKYRVHP